MQSSQQNLPSSPEGLKSMNAQAEINRAKFSRNNNTHEENVTNTVGRIILRLWDRYAINLAYRLANDDIKKLPAARAFERWRKGDNNPIALTLWLDLEDAEITTEERSEFVSELNRVLIESESPLKKLIADDFAVWIMNIPKLEKLNDEERFALKEEQKWFTERFTALASRIQGDLDYVFIYNPETKEKKERHTVFMWKVLWCLIMAARDNDCFVDKDSVCADRFIGLYQTIKMYLQQKNICNTGVRNTPTQQLLHQKYRARPHEPLVYVVTELLTDINNLVNQYYADKLQQLLSSTNQSERELGYTILTQWLDVEDGEERTAFLDDAEAVTESVQNALQLMGLDPAEPSVAVPISKYVAYRNEIDVPSPKNFVPVIELVKKMKENPERYSSVVSEFIACRELSDVSKLMGHVRKNDLLQRIEDVCNIIPFGQFESDMIATGRRIEHELREIHEIDHDRLFKVIEKLENEIEAAINRARINDNGGIIADSFAILAQYEGNLYQFRTHIHDFVKRANVVLDNEQLETFLRTHLTIYGQEAELVLSPLAVSRIVWHALCVSPMNWSEKFCIVIELLLMKFKKERTAGTKEEWIRPFVPVVPQLEWLLTCAKTKEIIEMPEEVYMPCNLGGLAMREYLGDLDDYSDFDSSNESDEVDEDQQIDLNQFRLLTACNNRGWWFELPGKLNKITDVVFSPSLGKVASWEVISDILLDCSEKQRLIEIDKCREDLDRLSSEKRLALAATVIKHSSKSIRSALLISFWDWDTRFLQVIPDEKLPDLVSAMAKKEYSSQQVFTVFKRLCEASNSKYALLLLENHIKTIVKDNLTEAESELIERIYGLVNVKSRKDFLLYRSTMNSYETDKIEVNLSAKDVENHDNLFNPQADALTVALHFIACDFPEADDISLIQMLLAAGMISRHVFIGIFLNSIYNDKLPLTDALSALVVLTNDYLQVDSQKQLPTQIITSKNFQLLKLILPYLHVEKLTECVLAELLRLLLPDLSTVPFNATEGELISLSKEIHYQLENKLMDRHRLLAVVELIKNVLPKYQTISMLGKLLNNVLSLYENSDLAAGKAWCELVDQFENHESIVISDSTLTFILNEIKNSPEWKLSNYGVTRIVLHALRTSPIYWSNQLVNIISKLLANTPSSLVATASAQESTLLWKHLKTLNDIREGGVCRDLSLPCTLSGVRLSKSEFDNSERFEYALLHLINWTVAPTALIKAGDWYDMPKIRRHNHVARQNIDTYYVPTSTDLLYILDRSPKSDQLKILFIYYERFQRHDIFKYFAKLSKVEQDYFINISTALNEIEDIRRHNLIFAKCWNSFTTEEFIHCFRDKSYVGAVLSYELSGQLTTRNQFLMGLIANDFFAEFSEFKHFFENHRHLLKTDSDILDLHSEIVRLFYNTDIYVLLHAFSFLVQLFPHLINKLSNQLAPSCDIMQRMVRIYAKIYPFFCKYSTLENSLNLTNIRSIDVYTFFASNELWNQPGSKREFFSDLCIVIEPLRDHVEFYSSKITHFIHDKLNYGFLMKLHEYYISHQLDNARTSISMITEHETKTVVSIETEEITISKALPDIYMEEEAYVEPKANIGATHQDPRESLQQLLKTYDKERGFFRRFIPGVPGQTRTIKDLHELLKSNQDITEKSITDILHNRDNRKSKGRSSAILNSVTFFQNKAAIVPEGLSATDRVIKGLRNILVKADKAQ